MPEHGTNISPNKRNQLIYLKNNPMKKSNFLLFALPLMVACNNNASDSVEKADSANEAKMDSPSARPGITTDEESTNFLVKAADGGLAEVALSEQAQQKATNNSVKQFAQMMVNDHSGANTQVKSLAVQRNVTLPATPGSDHQGKIEDLSKKNGADFDRSYMNTMIDDHQKTIDLFEDASGDVKDAEVKTFIDNTLPKLRMHLDSAKAIQKRLK
jgi:putative membrane protein